MYSWNKTWPCLPWDYSQFRYYICIFNNIIKIKYSCWTDIYWIYQLQSENSPSMDSENVSECVYEERKILLCIFISTAMQPFSLTVQNTITFFATSLISPECPSWKPKPYIFCKHNKRDSYLLLGAISKLCKRKWFQYFPQHNASKTN